MIGTNVVFVQLGGKLQLLTVRRLVVIKLIYMGEVSTICEQSSLLFSYVCWDDGEPVFYQHVLDVFEYMHGIRHQEEGLFGLNRMSYVKPHPILGSVETELCQQTTEPHIRHHGKNRQP